ncbi:MAG: DUF1501 domain-containing protein [Planctomycetota bacterium]
MNLDRRTFLGATASGAALGFLSPLIGSPFLGRALAAGAGGTTARKMLVIFMRGGNDGINTCIPYGDPEYNQVNRPGIFIPDTQAIDLGNGFAALHPALGPLHELHLAGQLATVHRVAYANQSRSHFDSQHFWENAVPGDNELYEGWAYRQAIESYDLATQPLAAASVSDRMMMLFRGPTALPQISDLATYNLEVPGTSQSKLLGTSPGDGLLGWYDKTSGSTHGHDALVASAGLSVGDTLSALGTAGTDPSTYVPENGATYPSADDPQGFGDNSFPFFQKLRDAVILLKQTDLRLAGVELDGFDTHSNQGGPFGAQAALLAWIAHGIRSVSLDLGSAWDDTLVVTLSEFGRTSEQNGSGGTDHGEASCLFVAGGSVNGGVYNCDSTTWAPGDMFSTPNGRYVSHAIDFRAVLREVLDRHFNLTPGAINTVLPGIGGTAGDPTFADLGFLP